MSSQHHTAPMSDELKSLFGEAFKQQDTTDSMRELVDSLGATGRYPQGVLGDDDEGELRMGIAAIDGRIVLAFGKRVTTLAWHPEALREICQQLLDKAEECDGIGARVRLVKD